MDLSQRKTLQPNSKCLKNPNRKKQYQMSHPVSISIGMKVKYDRMNSNQH